MGHPAIYRVSLSLSLSYICLLPQFYQNYAGKNRVLVGWAHGDSFALGISMAAIAAALWIIITLAHVILQRRRIFYLFAQRIGCIFLLAITARSIVSITVRSNPESGLLTFIEAPYVKVVVYLFLPAVFCFLCPLAKIRAIAKAYVIISPAPIILACSLPFWPVESAHDKRYDPPARPLSAEANDIFIFLFDEWSYERTFTPEGRLVCSMPNLESLLNVSTFYTSAYSPGASTGVSIPRLLFQNEEDVFGQYDIGQILVGKGAPNTPGIYELLDPLSVRYRIAVGFLLDYPSILRDRCRRAVSVGPPVGGMRISLFGKINRYIAAQMWWLRYFGGAKLHRQMMRPVVSEYTYEMTYSMFTSTLHSVDGPMIGFFHVCLPHFPYVWRGGRRSERLPTDWAEHTIDNYMNNLYGLDHLIGQIMSELKLTGRYNESTLVFLSDHNWRWDPKLSAQEQKYYDKGFPGPHFESNKTHRLKHVPLIIKNVAQTNRLIVREPVYTVKLHELITDE